MRTIVWDVDDVLNDFTKNWLENYWLKNNTGSKIKYSRLTENPPNSILNISLQKYLESIDEFRIKYGKSLKPNPKIFGWFEKNGNNYRHIALSSIPMFYSPISSQWVFKHYGRWIRTYNFVPSSRANDKCYKYDKDKADIIKRLNNIDLFIDDNLINIESVANLGIKTLIRPQPWNSDEIILDNTEINKYFNIQIKKLIN